MISPIHDPPPDGDEVPLGAPAPPPPPPPAPSDGSFTPPNLNSGILTSFRKPRFFSAHLPNASLSVFQSGIQEVPFSDPPPNFDARSLSMFFTAGESPRLSRN